MLRDGTFTAASFRNGERWITEYVLKPGASTSFTIELDLNKKGMTKDWSFTAWGENGEVEVNIIGKAK